MPPCRSRFFFFPMTIGHEPCVHTLSKERKRKRSVRSHFGWEGDGLPDSGPKQQAAGSQGPSHPRHNGWLRTLVLGTRSRSGVGCAWVNMRLCFLLAGPSVVLFPRTELFGCWGDGGRQPSPHRAPWPFPFGGPRICVLFGQRFPAVFTALPGWRLPCTWARSWVASVVRHCGEPVSGTRVPCAHLSFEQGSAG